MVKHALIWLWLQELSRTSREEELIEDHFRVVMINFCEICLHIQNNDLLVLNGDPRTYTYT